MKTVQAGKRWERLERAADRFIHCNYDVFVLFAELTRGRQKERFTQAGVRSLWSPWARDVREGRKPSFLNLYVHIPYCASVCNFCMHYVKKARGEEEKSRYVEGLVSQAADLAPVFEGIPVRNLSIGGGTPSVLSAAQLGRLLGGLSAAFRFVPEGERTFEALPESLTDDKMDVLLRGGINRLSVGVQSLNSDVLEAVNRGYQKFAETLRVIRRARELGFSRGVNVDLILGLVRDDAPSFLRTFSRVADERPNLIFINHLRPMPQYVKLHYGGDAQAALDHYHGMVEGVKRPLVELAVKKGYLNWGGPDRPWYLVLQDYYDRVSDYSGLSDFQGETNVLPFSILGLGTAARSHVAGYGSCLQTQAYEARKGEDDVLYEGGRHDIRSEAMKSLFAAARDNLAISGAEFKQWFGLDLESEFGGALEVLRRRGYARREKGGVRFRTRSSREAMLCALCLAGPAAVAGARRPAEPEETVPRPSLRPAPRTCPPLELDLADRRLTAERALSALQKARERGSSSARLTVTRDLRRLASCLASAHALGFEERRVRFPEPLDAEPAALAALGRAAPTHIELVFWGGAGASADWVEERTRLDALSRTRGPGGWRVSAVRRLDGPGLRGLEAFLDLFADRPLDELRLEFAGSSYAEAMPAVYRVMLLNEKRWRLPLRFAGIPPCMLRFAVPPPSARLARRLEGALLEGSEAPGSRQGPPCAGCSRREACGGVPESYARRRGFSELLPLA